MNPWKSGRQVKGVPESPKESKVMLQSCFGLENQPICLASGAIREGPKIREAENESESKTHFQGEVGQPGKR